MACVAAQAQERRWLAQHIIRHRPVGFVANRAVFGYRRMFVSERALFFRMAAIAHHIDGCPLAQVTMRLAMAVVAIGTEHFSFFDRMMRRHRSFGKDLRMALVTGVWLLDRHW
jgi:hypothetical protein